MRGHTAVVIYLKISQLLWGAGEDRAGDLSSLLVFTLMNAVLI